MKKRLLFILIHAGITACAQPVDSLRFIVDSGLSIMQRNALLRHEVDWNVLRREMYSRTKGIANVDTLLSKFPWLFQQLHDFHGGIQAGNKWISWKEGRPIAKSNPALDTAMKKGPFHLTKRLGNIGYYRVPGGSTKNIAAVTQMLADSLCKLDPAAIEGWIIDLRLNTGGNIWFMLASMATLIGDGPIGGYKYADGKPDNTIFIKDGRVFGNNQFYGIPVPACMLPPAGTPVVVLVGPKTASSGEGTMLAFKGRPHTTIIGEPTAGFITSNSSFNLRKDITLIVATGYMRDRSGKFYTESLQPDVFIRGGDNFYDFANDLKIIKAQEWLQEKIRKQGSAQ